MEELGLILKIAMVGIIIAILDKIFDSLDSYYPCWVGCGIYDGNKFNR